MTTILDVLTDLGVVVGLDWDDELLIERPETIDGAVIDRLVEKHKILLMFQVRNRAARQRHRLVGGPFHGQPYPYEFGQPAYYARQVKRGKWAVYNEQVDGRAIFVGYATSRAKARCGVLQPGKP